MATVIVTGAAGGLGLAACQRLLDEGYRVVGVDLAEASLINTDYSHHICDISVAERVEALFDELGSHGAIYGLVNAAGITRDGMLRTMSEKDFDQVVSVNLKGTFLMAQAWYRLLAGAPGAMVNVASVSSEGNVGQTNYAAAKAGVVAMTKTWALEMARDGVRVNAVAPGLFDTEMIRSIPEHVMERMKKRIPLGRVGEPKEFAGMVAFLLSEDASYLTGQILRLDGGLGAGGF